MALAAEPTLELQRRRRAVVVTASACLLLGLVSVGAGAWLARPQVAQVLQWLGVLVPAAAAVVLALAWRRQRGPGPMRWAWLGLGGALVAVALGLVLAGFGARLGHLRDAKPRRAAHREQHAPGPSARPSARAETGQHALGRPRPEPGQPSAG